MKKFVGNVNGKEYTNYEDFTKAVDALFASNESEMLISSYYKECNDECDCEDTQKCIEDETPQDTEYKPEKTPLDFDKFLLTRDSEKNINGSYVIPSNIKELFDNASNVDEIRKEIESKIRTNKNIAHNNEIAIGELRSKISNLKHDMRDANKQVDYYNALNDILNNKVTSDKFADLVQSIKKNETALEVVNDLVTGFDGWLNRIGFWK